MYKIALIADLHYFSKKLSDGGKAYRLRSSSDQKCLLESGAIIDSAFESILESGADALLLAGDMSNDGEKVSHLEIKDKIAELQKKIPVYVTFATHDWCSDGNAKRFAGDKYYNDVEVMTPPELRELYKNFGENQAEDTYVNEIGACSYCLWLNDKTFLIAVNDDKNGNGCSGYSDQHFAWIIKHVKEAKSKGAVVLLMQHHLLLPCISNLVNKGQIIADNMERAEDLCEAGVDFVIVGHSHMMRNTGYVSKSGNKMCQINLSALCGHPAAVTYMTIDDDKISLDASYIKKFTYEGQEYGADYITEHTKNVLLGILNAGANDDEEEFLDRVCAIADNIKRDDVKKLYPVLKRVCKFLLNVTVGKAGSIINALTFGSGIDKAALKQIKDNNLISHVMNIYLSVFDGSIVAYGTDSPVYKIVKDVVALPSKIGAKLHIKALTSGGFIKTLKGVDATVEELLNPKGPDCHHLVIERKP